MPAVADPGADDAQREPPWQRAARAFVAAAESGRLDLPRPGAGRTRERFATFADLAAEDLSLARLAEGHADALAILAEIGAPGQDRVPAGSRWGVWAASPPGPSVTAVRDGSGGGGSGGGDSGTGDSGAGDSGTGDSWAGDSGAGDSGGWRLRGTKRYCSGARVCTHALVTARAGDGMRLFAVAVADLVPRTDSWPATGMAGTDTLDVDFPGVAAEPVGPPEAYTRRPGFSHGGVGVAACWYGGARAIGETLRQAAAKRDLGPHALAHLGAVDIALRTGRAAREQAADEIDADPADRRGDGGPRALRVRALTEALATDVTTRVGRALGAGPLGHDPAHSRAVADLTVYLRQHHAEADLAALGAIVADRGTTW